MPAYRSARAMAYGGDGGIETQTGPMGMIEQLGNQGMIEALAMGSEQASSSILGLFGDEPEVDENRVAADAELRAKFEVGEGGGTTKDGKAVLSQAEYDAMLDTYANIRSGDSNLKITTQGIQDPEEAEAFKTNALDTLTTMMQTEVGRDLVHNLTHGDNLKDVVIASGSHSIEGVDGRSDQYRFIGNRAIANNEANASNGQGSSTSVFWAGKDREGTKDGKTTVLNKDTTMFHELTHAYHNMKGINDTDRVTQEDVEKYGVPLADVGGTKHEEHQTIGIGGYSGEYISENTYRSQRKAFLEATGDTEEAADYERREAWNVGARAEYTDNPLAYQRIGKDGWVQKS